MYSDFSVRPGHGMIILWVVSGWIREFSIVVLFVHGLLCSLGDLDEVSEVLSVGEVLVQVVLHVLDEVHVLLDEVISSNSGESKRLVVQFPSFDGNLWVFALFLELSVDLHSIIVVLHVEVSGEVVQLDIEFSL